LSVEKKLIVEGFDGFARWRFVLPMKVVAEYGIEGAVAKMVLSPKSWREFKHKYKKKGEAKKHG